MLETALIAYDLTMCNRFRILSTRERLTDALEVVLDRLDVPLPGEFFPGSRVPIVRHGESGRELISATWGIHLGRHRVTNSRDDKIASVWGRYMRHRVIFPVDQAVEWHYDLDLLGQPTGKPRPWVIGRSDHAVAAVAGIADGDCVSMMTCPANAVYGQVHNKDPDDPRMLAYLTTPQEIAAWLNNTLAPPQYLPLLRPAPDTWLTTAPLGG